MNDYYDFEKKPEKQPQAEKPERTAKQRRKKNWLTVALIIGCIAAGSGMAALVALPINLAMEAAEGYRDFGAYFPEPTPAETEAPSVLDPKPLPTGGEEVQLGGVAPPIVSVENPVVQIAELMGPAVVGVRASVFDSETDETLSELEYSYGSGFIVSENGYIVTNHHVIDEASRFSVVMNDGEEVPADLIGSDSFSDIAVLKIDAQNLTVSPIGNSDAVRVGELAVAIGSPLGESLGGSVTVGYISAVHRDVEGSEYLQTDAAINPGNSGGPLVNVKGEVIGINALKSYIAGFDEYGVPIATEGIGFAIPINDAMDVVREVIRTGWVERPGIGIIYVPMSAEEAEARGLPRGALVEEITEGGPADIGGMKVGDVIIAVDGQAIGSDPDKVRDIIRTYSVGETVTITVWRESDKQEHDILVVIGDLNRLD